MSQADKSKSFSSPVSSALVISLDFELHWGIRDKQNINGSYRDKLLGTRAAISAILEMFTQYGVGATWATVGFLFAKTRSELEAFHPQTRPCYENPKLNPYDEPIGFNEVDDPFHYAPSVIERIRRTPRQEIATQTYSHYYALEPGQDRVSFEMDLRSAVSIAKTYGITLRSIVYPRNQYNPAYDDVLSPLGLVCFRGNQRAWIYRPSSGRCRSTVLRGLRFLDSYLPICGPHTTTWNAIALTSPCNIPASFFIRPYKPHHRAFEKLRAYRIKQALGQAAKRGEIVHLWWHPWNFGVHLEENMAFLRELLDTFGKLRTSHAMESLTMAEVANRILKSSN